MNSDGGSRAEAEHALVDIGTHRLSAFLHGPSRSSGQPIVIVFPGLMGCVKDWAAFIRHAKPQCRILAYYRSGYGSSDSSPKEPMFDNTSAELNSLLDALNIDPPFITVANSWGGCIAFDWVSARQPSDIAGMVFADAATPESFETLPMGFKDPDMVAITSGVDFAQVMRLLDNIALTPQEIVDQGAEKASGKHNAQAGRKWAIFDASFPLLARKRLLERDPPLLGGTPICVVKGNVDQDYQLQYDVGVAAGNGTELQRRKFRHLLSGWREMDEVLQRHFFRHSTTGKYVQASEKSGHFVQLREPEVIVDAVLWTLDHRSGVSEATVEHVDGPGQQSRL